MAGLGCCPGFPGAPICARWAGKSIPSGTFPDPLLGGMLPMLKSGKGADLFPAFGFISGGIPCPIASLSSAGAISDMLGRGFGMGAARVPLVPHCVSTHVSLVEIPSLRALHRQRSLLCSRARSLAVRLVLFFSIRESFACRGRHPTPHTNTDNAIANRPRPKINLSRNFFRFVFFFLWFQKNNSRKLFLGVF